MSQYHHDDTNLIAQEDRLGRSLLHLIVLNAIVEDKQDLQDFKVALREGGDPVQEDDFGNTPLSDAARLGHTSMVKDMLCAMHERLETGEVPRRTAPRMAKTEQNLDLIDACSRNARQEVVRYLSDGADPNTYDADGATPLELTSDSRIQTLLLKQGACPALIEQCEESLIEDGVLDSDLDYVKFLHHPPEGIPAIHPMRSAALGAAAFEGYIELITYLLDNGHDVNRIDESGALPLSSACSVEVLDLLWEAGADINGPEKDGAPLYGAILLHGDKTGLGEKIRWFREKGADFNATNSARETVLMRCVDENEICRENRMKNDRQLLPLNIQVDQNIQCLLSYGADTELINEDRLTAYDFTTDQTSHRLRASLEAKRKRTYEYISKPEVCARFKRVCNRG